MYIMRWLEYPAVYNVYYEVIWESNSGAISASFKY